MRTACACVTFAQLLFVGGCSNKVNVRGDGFGESFSQSAGYERPKEKSAKPFGFSTKAREIESDFGVR